VAVQVPKAEDLELDPGDGGVPRKATGFGVEIEGIEAGLDFRIDQVDTLQDLSLSIGRDVRSLAFQVRAILAMLGPRLKRVEVRKEIEVGIGGRMIGDPPKAAGMRARSPSFRGAKFNTLAQHGERRVGLSLESKLDVHDL